MKQLVVNCARFFAEGAAPNEPNREWFAERQRPRNVALGVLLFFAIAFGEMIAKDTGGLYTIAVLAVLYAFSWWGASARQSVIAWWGLMVYVGGLTIVLAFVLVVYVLSEAVRAVIG